MQHLYVVILFLCVFIGFDCIAQSIQSRLDSTQFLIGDQTRLIFEGTFSTPIEEINFSTAPFEEWSEIEYVTQSPLYKESVGDKVSYRRDFLIAFFDTGAYYIPKIPVYVHRGGQIDTLYSPQIPVHVRPFAVDSTLAPIKPIIREPFMLSGIFWWLVGSFLALKLLIALILLLVIRNRNKEHEEVIVSKTPYEQALDELKTLDEKGYIKLGKVKEHFSDLSMILRMFLERQMGFPAAELTTREIGYDLNRLGLNRDLSREILNKLEKIDLIKYAKAHPSTEEIVDSVHDVRLQIEAINHTSIRPDQSEEE